MNGVELGMQRNQTLLNRDEACLEVLDELGISLADLTLELGLLFSELACKFTEASLELEGLALCLNELELFLCTALVEFHWAPELLEDIVMYRATLALLVSTRFRSMRFHSASRDAVEL